MHLESSLHFHRMPDKYNVSSDINHLWIRTIGSAVILFIWVWGMKWWLNIAQHFNCLRAQCMLNICHKIYMRNFFVCLWQDNFLQHSFLCLSEYTNAIQLIFVIKPWSIYWKEKIIILSLTQNWKFANLRLGRTH